MILLRTHMESMENRYRELLAEKDEVKNATAASDWTQLYGEAWTFWAYAYTELVRHFGDVPFGIENSIVEEYTLTSRFEILDACIAKLKEVEGKMYYLGEGSIGAERMSRTFANALIAEANLLAGGYQTLRTDAGAPYGGISFVDQIETDATHNAVYARHGRTFKSADLQSLWECYAWYKKNSAYTDDLLTETDRHNIELIKATSKNCCLA
mgnify:CR=1 FL=1